ncbi:MAG TPA: ABC transporter permease [Burkholderiales bacterium]|nr:ABC transporter permease [Burkholderiales bacterium]
MDKQALRGTTAVPLSKPESAAAVRHGAKLLVFGSRLIPWVIAVGIWAAIPLTGLVSPALVPSPAHVLAKFWELMFQGRLWLDMLLSCERVLLGLFTGILLAIPVAFVIGWYKPARRMIDPLINFFRSLPPIALIPLVIVYFGIGEFAKVVMLFYAAFFSGVIVMYEGIVQTNPIFIRVARTLGATDGEIFRRVIVPLSLPHVLTAMRVALGIAWATLVASELIAAQKGLGAVIQNASNYFQIDTIYVGIICIGLLALTMDFILRRLTARLLSWQERIES